MPMKNGDVTNKKWVGSQLKWVGSQLRARGNLPFQTKPHNSDFRLSLVRLKTLKLSTRAD